MALSCLLAACGGNDGGQPAPSASLQPALRANISAFNGNGTWWNPAEPGSGIVFEAQGSLGVITYFTYEASGKPVWYSGAGAFGLRDDGKYAFSAPLYRYSGGQTADSATPKTPSRVEIGTTTVVFDGESAQVQIPGQSYVAKKFNPVTSAGGKLPETGIYWNAAESGRGYTIEVADNLAAIGVFHYDASGDPTWHLIVGDISSGKLNAPFTSYSGGQVFGGAYKPATAVPTQQQFQASFDNACQGTVQFPGMAAIGVSRFPFGVPPEAACRSSTAFRAVLQIQQQELSKVRPPDYHLDNATLFCEPTTDTYASVEVDLAANGVLRFKFTEKEDGAGDFVSVAYNAASGAVTAGADDGWEWVNEPGVPPGVFEHRSTWLFKGSLDAASRQLEGTLEETSSTRWTRDSKVQECKRTVRITAKP